MSTVCYCGQPDCPVTTWEHDACVANLRAERDALRAQVEAVRKRCQGLLEYEYSKDQVRTAAQAILDAVDGAAKT